AYARRMKKPAGTSHLVSAGCGSDSALPDGAGLPNVGVNFQRAVQSIWHMTTPLHDPATSGDRRDFLKKACSVCIGGAIGAVPVAAGMAVYLDPLKRKGAGSLLVRVGSLDSLPADGTPTLFPVIATRTDAWTKMTAPVGAVYVRRVNEKTLQVFNATCPHAGCAVEFQMEKEGSDKKAGYHCPCHDSDFTLEGKRSEESPAARDLDSLDYEIRKGGQVWVNFENFQTGHKEKLPAA
ncbi:MAG: Rieske 2Fe-2S domain-containing protein, partial [Terriglobales bacterium]